LKVGILGSGDVGRALGRGFASRGYDVKIGSRTPDSEKLKQWLNQVEGKATVGTFAEVADHGEMLILAIMGSAAENAIDLAGNEKFAGKVMIDVTNPLDFSNGAAPGLFVGTNDSLGERIQRKLPLARVVKCFNTVPNPQMVNPDFGKEELEMLICGNDMEAKQKVIGILKEFGWRGAIDIGGIEEAR
jgi:8-hydroxy-5-deazaflavin:NADPH oxidoreductase